MILGFDPGLRNCGLCVFDGTQPVASAAIGQKPSDKKRRLHKADDFYLRLRMVGNRIRKTILAHRPQAIALESYTPPPSKQAAVDLAAVNGLIMQTSIDWKTPIIWVLSEEIDEWLGKSNLGRKERKLAIRRKVLGRWPDHEWPRSPRAKQVPVDVTDAAAVAATAVERSKWSLR